MILILNVVAVVTTFTAVVASEQTSAQNHESDSEAVHLYLLMVPESKIDALRRRVPRQEEGAGAIGAISELAGPAANVGQILAGVLGGDLRPIFAGSTAFIPEGESREGVTQILQQTVAPAIQRIFTEFSRNVQRHFNSTTPLPNTQQQNNQNQGNFNQNQGNFNQNQGNFNQNQGNFNQNQGNYNQNQNQGNYNQNNPSQQNNFHPNFQNQNYNQNNLYQQNLVHPNYQNQNGASSHLNQIQPNYNTYNQNPNFGSIGGGGVPGGNNNFNQHNIIQREQNYQNNGVRQPSFSNYNQRQPDLINSDNKFYNQFPSNLATNTNGRSQVGNGDDQPSIHNSNVSPSHVPTRERPISHPQVLKEQQFQPPAQKIPLPAKP